ncbi:MAG: nucleotide exchange factor GrpE [Candidatus Micrarchaeota archaeon]
MAEEKERAGNAGETAGGKPGDAAEEDFEVLAERYSSELKYLAAEFDNYKKRAAKERKAEGQAGVEKLVAELLPVLDDFDATLSALKEGGADAKVIDGVELLQKKLLKILEGKGLKRVQSVGERFDVGLHDAAGFEENDGAEDGSVVRELQAGYAVGDIVVRHAKVIVSKNPEAGKGAPK